MSKFDNILIATDLDGTFFSSTTGEVERNIKAVKYFTSNGGLFTFATGRLSPYINAYVPNAGTYVNCPAVTCNGMSLYDLKKKEPIRETFTDTKLIVDTVHYLLGRYEGLAFRGMGLEGVISFQPENKFIIHETKYGKIPPKIVPLEKWGEKKLYKLALRASVEELDRVKKDIEAHFPQKYNICRSWSNVMELHAYGTSKASLLGELRDEISKYKKAPIKLYAVGDYENDMEMLQMADVAVCPENALDTVKAMCDFCFCNNDEGVIADLIEYMDKTL